MQNSEITRVAWGVLEGTRPRAAGSNARLGAHGTSVRVPILQITTADGISGFGACRKPDQARELIGRRIADLITSDGTVAESWRAFDFPLWDLAGKLAGKPVYALAGGSHTTRFSAPCYDTSLYFDDLHLADDRQAADLIAAEAWEGYQRGHRSFKIKVGRGARHLPPETGLQRDIAIIRAVRATIGTEARIMIDANNGYTLNLARHVLDATADCRIFWLEEAFHEDDILYRELRAWLVANGIATLIADGEGSADPRLLTWARDGIIDVVQYDIFDRTFSGWLTLGKQLDAWKIRSAPHHYGGHYGNFAAGHLAAAIQGFAYVEWDEASVAGLDTSGYWIEAGRVQIPDLPGFGIMLDEERFAAAVTQSGMAW